MRVLNFNKAGIKCLLPVLLGAAMLNATAQPRPKPNFTIQGSLNNIADVRMVYLLTTRGVMVTQTDSAQVSNNKYTLKGNVESGQQAYLLTYNIRNAINVKNGRLARLFVSPGKFTVTHTDTFNNISIKGPAAYKHYLALQTEIKPFDEKARALRTEAIGLTKKGDTASAANIYARLDTFETNYKTQVYGRFIKSNPHSGAAFYALKEMAGQGHGIDGIKLKPYFDMLLPGIKQSTAGQELNKRIYDAITFDTHAAIGSTAPDFSLPDTSGRLVGLSAYRGKYVLVDFWASWCTPCRADNPHLLAAYRQFHDKGFEILSVSLDVKAREKAWRAAIAHDKISAWAHVADLERDTNRVIALYGVSGIPQNFLIDPDGKIIGRSLRGGSLEEKLAAILKN